MKDRDKRWIGCEVENDYLGENRKESKLERKKAIAKDRSKFKKTDKSKYLKSVEREKSKI